MKTQKRKTVAPEAKTASAGEPTASTANAQQIESEKPNRISFNVTPEGAPDFERMSVKTREELTRLLSNASVQKQLGITREQTAEISALSFGDDEANMLLDMLSGATSTAATMLYKIPREVTSVAFAFTAEQRKKINPPLSRVLNKWGPALLKTYKDEIGLTIVLFGALNAQVTLMHILEAQRQKRAKAPATPPSPTPIRPDFTAPSEPVPVVDSPHA